MGRGGWQAPWCMSTPMMYLITTAVLPLACKVDPQQLSKVLGNIKGYIQVTTTTTKHHKR